MDKPDILYRWYATNPESAAKLAKKAAEAEKVIGIHGVSVSSNLKEPSRQASWASLEAQFKLHKTGGPGHYTIELPKPVTDEVARKFNQVFGR